MAVKSFIVQAPGLMFAMKTWSLMVESLVRNEQSGLLGPFLSYKYDYNKMSCFEKIKITTEDTKVKHTNISTI